MSARIEWVRHEDSSDPEFDIPYYTARVRDNLTAKIEMDPYWSHDSNRPKCDGWTLIVGNVCLHFPREKGDRGGRKALAEAKALGLRFFLKPKWR